MIFFMLSIPISLKTDANLALTIHQEHPDVPDSTSLVYPELSASLTCYLAQRLFEILKNIVNMLYTNG